MYVERYQIEQEEKKALEEANWLRFRIGWADFRNANRGKNSTIVHGKDLIKLSIDERPAEYHEIDMEFVKKRLGSKIRKKDGK